MSLQRLAILVFAGVLLAGCETVGEYSAAAPLPAAIVPPPAVHPAPAPAGPPADARPVVPVLAIADPSMALPRPGTPSGVVLLSRGTQRNQAVCKALFETMEPYSGRPIPEAKSRPTYWLETDPPGTTFSTDCTVRLGRYDFGRALAFLGRLNLIGRRGPVLLGLAKAGQGSGPGLVLDLSSTPDDQLPGAIQIWQRRIILDVQQWDPTWDWEMLRWELRNIFIRATPVISQVRFQ
jgi:hypothetical protein